MSFSNSPSDTLPRRTSLKEKISIRPRLPSLRSRKSTASTTSNAQAPQTDNRNSYTPYAVYQQKMYPVILRDADATTKLLEAILDTPGGRRSVARLARTCKAFKEPALDILWRDLDSITPLIGLFPNTLLKRARRPGLGLAKNPEPAEWDRVLAYGERVRSISYIEAKGDVSPSIFPVFEETRPRTYILPNLTSLTWRAETSANLDRCRLFMGPELQTLVLEAGTRHPKLSDLLAEIACHTRLQSFSLTVHTNLPDNFTDIFKNNVALEKLSLTAPGAVAHTIGKWASSLPALRSFHLDLTGRTPTAVEGFFEDISPGSGYSTPSSVGGTDSGVFSADEVDFSDVRKSAARLVREGPRPGAFPVLSNLQLSGPTANIAMFLRHLTSPLISVELLIDDPPAPEDWQEVCGLICDQFGHTLQSMKVGATSASRFSELVRATSRSGDTPVQRLPLQHLSSLPRLVRLEVDLPESCVFHNEDLAHLARIAPALEIVRLCALTRFPPSAGPPALTLDGITPLTRACRRLHTLGVVVNALDAPEAVFKDVEVSSRSLLRLQVGHSWIRDPFQVAILISHLAPWLENLKWFHEKNRVGVVEANALAWQKALEYLPHIQNIRLMERGRAPPSPIITVTPPPPPPPRPETSEKEVDATVQTTEHEVWARPELVEDSVQVSVEVADFSVQMSPETAEVEIDAEPVFVDEAVDALPQMVDHSVDAHPETVEKATDSRSAGQEEPVANGHVDHDKSPEISASMPLPFLSGAGHLMSFTVRVVRFYTSPLRYMLSFMPIPFLTEYVANGESEPKGALPGTMQDESERDLEKRESAPSESTASENIGTDIPTAVCL
ncbi:hypothetical protein CERSUDRAFT_42012 [Gelatoporia subvermispora B]|uniref:F-box domain-containing protein n=1 Tax=Ceriporiopsis subvermispora (strain B) TaxID=914234 RepID=M2RSQ7_CERS8|nr:hypothetical protein CERSUDRAFT_42012 [Gelatoporia subvermispora B]